MPAYYTVVRYVPDIVRDERVNIGVIAFSDHDKQAVFLNNWYRVRILGGNPEAVKAACAELEKLDVKHLRAAVAKWSHSIQLSEPCASLQDVTTLLLDSANRFLVDPEGTEPGYKTKADILRRTKQSLREAVARTVSPAARKMIRDDATFFFPGHHEKHVFDLCAHNGRPIFGANAISFEVPQMTALKRLVDATKWAIEDVKEQDNSISLSVVVSKPRSENQLLFEQSRDVFQQLGAKVEYDTELESWSSEIASTILAHMPERLRPAAG